MAACHPLLLRRQRRHLRRRQRRLLLLLLLISCWGSEQLRRGCQEPAPELERYQPTGYRAFARGTRRTIGNRRSLARLARRAWFVSTREGTHEQAWRLVRWAVCVEHRHWRGRLLIARSSPKEALLVARSTHPTPRSLPPLFSAGAQFEGSNEIGVFARLTNSYCLVTHGGSQNFYSIFESELADHMPVVHTSIAGCRFVGRVTVGNKRGLLVPNGTTDQELQHLRNALPESVSLQVCACPRAQGTAAAACHNAVGPHFSPSPTHSPHQLRSPPLPSPAR